MMNNFERWLTDIMGISIIDYLFHLESIQKREVDAQWQEWKKEHRS